MMKVPYLLCAVVCLTFNLEARDDSRYKKIAWIVSWHGRFGFYDDGRLQVYSKVATWLDEEYNKHSGYPDWEGEYFVVKEYEWRNGRFSPTKQFLTDERNYLKRDNDWYETNYDSLLENFINTNDKIPDWAEDTTNYLQNKLDDLFGVYIKDFDNVDNRRLVPEEISSVIPSNLRVKKLLKHDVDNDGIEEVILSYSHSDYIFGPPPYIYHIGIFILEKDSLTDDWYTVYKYDTSLDDSLREKIGTYQDMDIRDINGDGVNEIILKYVNAGGSGFSRGIIVFALDMEQKYSEIYFDGGLFEKIYQFKKNYEGIINK